ncbi:unnamed protein product [Hydatigera taeniaeformis]|uniref:Uncharacterized protein n=1 Tax=Hydatigena taeniaeformis TaxID=6205 RepID=A0A0R3XCR6_HYDTA|nr:unnamed protein product [Hydatigera taeniaeformis]
MGEKDKPLNFRETSARKRVHIEANVFSPRRFDGVAKNADEGGIGVDCPTLDADDCCVTVCITPLDPCLRCSLHSTSGLRVGGGCNTRDSLASEMVSGKRPGMVVDVGWDDVTTTSPVANSPLSLFSGVEN